MESELRMAYLAGIIDGDGSLSLIRKQEKDSVSPLYYPCMQLMNLDQGIINMFKSQFGGNVGVKKAYVGSDGCKRREINRWKLEKAPKCYPVLNDLVNYLIIKKDRAQLLLQYIKDNPFKRGQGTLTFDVLQNRHSTYLKMKSLNESKCYEGNIKEKKRRKNTDNQVFWAYLAGLMDTDGSFSIKKEKNLAYQPVILLSMTDYRGINYIIDNCQYGRIMLVKSKTSNQGFCYRFGIFAKQDVIGFLEKIIPYLTIKKSAANTLLRFCNEYIPMNGQKGISQDQKELREAFYQILIAINNGVFKSPLMDLKPLPSNVGGNKAEGSNATVNVVSEETT